MTNAPETPRRAADPGPRWTRPGRDPVATRDALATARTLAAGHPRARMPCPQCGVSLKGANLRGHLVRVHGGTGGHVETPRTHPRARTPRWWGTDRTMLGPACLLPAVWASCVAAAAGLGIPLPGPSFVALCVVGVLAFVPVVLVALGYYGADLAVEGDDLVLRHFGGWRVRRVELSAPMQTGKLIERRVSAVVSAYAADAPGSFGEYDVVAGSYLRVGTGRRAIIIGARRGTGFRAHWDPGTWSHGPRRRRWDITLTRDDLVEIEYALARRQLLQLRDGKSSSASQSSMLLGD